MMTNAYLHPIYGDWRMSELNRRQLLRRLAECVTSAGTILLASTVLAKQKEVSTATPGDPAERADRLADELPPLPEDVEPTSFLNRGFRNRAVGGGFANGGFRNRGVGGGFANGGFRNGGVGVGGFRNGAFRNW
jgi:hypothetical protein